MTVIVVRVVPARVSSRHSRNERQKKNQSERYGERRPIAIPAPSMSTESGSLNGAWLQLDLC